MIKIFFVGAEWKNQAQYEKLLEKMVVMTPGNSGIWKNIKAVKRMDRADWIVVLEDTLDKKILNGSRGNGRGNNGGAAKVMVFPREPPYVRRKNYLRYGLRWGLTYKKIYHVLANLDTLGMNYDQLISLKAPSLSEWSERKKICCVVSGKKHTKGARARLSFLQKFVSKYPGVMDIYGRGDLSFLGSDWKGPISGKISVLGDYQYSLCMENGRVENYFTEKITDVCLAWTFPVYWGCPNIFRYFEKGSYVKVDILKGDFGVEKLKAVVDGQFDEMMDLQVLSSMRDRILNKYNIWENIWRIANKKGIKI